MGRTLVLPFMLYNRKKRGLTMKKIILLILFILYSCTQVSNNPIEIEQSTTTSFLGQRNEQLSVYDFKDYPGNEDDDYYVCYYTDSWISNNYDSDIVVYKDYERTIPMDNVTIMLLYNKIILLANTSADSMHRYEGSITNLGDNVYYYEIQEANVIDCIDKNQNEDDIDESYCWAYSDVIYTGYFYHDSHILYLSHDYINSFETMDLTHPLYAQYPDE